MKTLGEMARVARDASATSLDDIVDPNKRANEERRLALRSEVKRKIAGLSIKRQRISELQAIVDKLNDDSDTAAGEHAQAAGELQAELDQLDSEHVDGIMSGKKASQKSLERRTQILTALAGLNNQLEARCEANKRSKLPFEKQIADLRKAIVDGATLEFQLQRLSSPAALSKIASAEFDIRICEIGLKEAQRRHGIHEMNYTNSKNWDDSQRNGIESSESALLKAKLEESIALLADRQQRFAAAMEASRNALLAAADE